MYDIYPTRATAKEIEKSVRIHHIYLCVIRLRTFHSPLKGKSAVLRSRKMLDQEEMERAMYHCCLISINLYIP